MADTPETPPAKRVKKASPAKAPKAKPAKAALSGTLVKAAPVKTATTRKAAAPKTPGNGAVAHGWTAQIAPIKAQAEKAAKAAADKLNAVDWKAHIDPLKDQASKTAKSAAGVAKDKTGSAMQSLAKLISDTAGTVDAKLGPQYGDYARQAAESVAGAAKTLDSKDVDQLMTEARDFVRKSPAVAIGAAAVVGFVLMRLAKGPDEDA
ncbi:hypothetical protein Sj15T_06000 [Sphingobium sp. TA15]|uniref:Uncharacterized protein n=3 Tax=Sphingobium indicum TaxID=332055 RepID=D4Z0Z8_SPHIU|nr:MULTISPECIES: hypothetical protein [Sphingobium]EPR16601.1 hypothetical protein M527_20205 [Sphingobium indicum IP26]KEY98229.1 hypothetical protein AI27_13380 [Sphingomonas sp. BHC-A]BDD65579.1 hypothetical protein Sj15T_06000 [Sphingobium sp. TA15]APL94340.1 hypothetical protein SIDU_07370 [Sphingobium indicum B90A]EQA98719.1 hypothetical protein L286_20565 [Sphingobium sp. HDIP04]